jgi:DNA (cytosine-5)-methyltransferase 1
MNTGYLYQYYRSQIRSYTNKCPTLTASIGTGGYSVPMVKDDYGIRRLTPLECFNLQGFPETYKLVGSDNALYTLCGNAVCVKVLDLV